MIRRKRRRRPVQQSTQERTYRTPEERQERRREMERLSREAAKGPIDLPFLLLTILLTVIGLVMLFSASFPSAIAESNDPAYYVKRQAIFAVLGFIAMAMVGKMNYQRLRGFAKLSMIVAVFLLILVIIPGVGITFNNATRWLGIPGIFTFQPSEIAKLAVILLFADSVSKKKDQMQTLKQGVLPYILVLAVLALLMKLEPHLSGMILIAGIGGMIMLVGGLPRWLIATGCVGVPVLATLFVQLSLNDKIPYGSDRIKMWANPFIDPLNEGYQMCQSLISIGSGGVLGVGFGKSRQKYLFLPEEHNDFIFAIVCEELGMIGACIIMLIFALLIIRGFWIALHARDRFGTLLVVGVMTQIALQTFLNIAVVTGLTPATGISLPFFSYGGTALALQLLEMGIVLSVSRQIPAPRNG